MVLCKQGTKWRALNNQTLCNRRDSTENPNQPHYHVGENTEISQSPLSERHMQVKTCKSQKQNLFHNSVLTYCYLSSDCPSTNHFCIRIVGVVFKSAYIEWGLS
ncbi:hypothetical protein XENORESO_007857 [Xenotaenia resolanae]|uniref:Uncharacterized protein n=1 Tax=Xenotaenia resolanae TaxID=208358 RepID=A0ABV0WLC6_9TELE